MELFAGCVLLIRFPFLLIYGLITYLSEYLHFEQQLSEYKEGTFLPCAKSFLKYIILFFEMYAFPFCVCVYVKELINSLVCLLDSSLFRSEQGDFLNSQEFLNYGLSDH